MRNTSDRTPPARSGKSAQRRVRRRWWGLGGLVLAGLAVSGFVGSSRLTGLTNLFIAPIRSAHAAMTGGGRDCGARPAALQQQLEQIARGFNGRVGIAVAKAGCDWIAGERLNDYFPQQSVSKLWVSLTVLDAVDHGKLTLDQPVTLRPEDLVVFNQPLRWQILEQGSVTLPAVDLMNNALSLSDNTANDRLLWTVGGPGMIRATLNAKEIDGIRFGPGERLLQSAIAGIEWKPELAEGNNFDRARAAVPLAARRTALDRYLDSPMDGAQPQGMARALARLASGELLSPQSTAVMMGIMARAHSGPRRLKAGVPHGWKVYHKTGTGQELAGTATGYNDVGILRAPDGTYYGVAVMIGETRQPIPVRMEMMQSVSRAVARFHDGGAGG